MTKDEFTAAATADGWRSDRFGHFHKEIEAKHFRLKIQKLAWRHELKYTNGWLKLRSGYYAKTGSFLPKIGPKP